VSACLDLSTLLSLSFSPVFLEFPFLIQWVGGFKKKGRKENSRVDDDSARSHDREREKERGRRSERDGGAESKKAHPLDQSDIVASL